MKKTSVPKAVETIIHDEASRKNIPTAEFQSVMHDREKSPVRVAYERRNRDLDPQLVWRGKDEQDWSDLVVQAPPLYIQEKVHPKVLIDDLMRRTESRVKEDQVQFDLFADFDRIADEGAKTEFYQHDQNWSNRMILGDSLQVMASLAEREGLRGRVQCIYFDPPYGIKFNSNFQWSTTSRDVKDGNADHITREPEQVKAFRDTWRDGIHSYLTYLRDRLTVARDLLTDSGSIFVQIGDENVHRVRTLLDDIFSDDNFISLIAFTKTSGFASEFLDNTSDYLVWYAKSKRSLKYRPLWLEKAPLQEGGSTYTNVTDPDGRERKLTKDEKSNLEILHAGSRLFALGDTCSDGAASVPQPIEFQGLTISPPSNAHWKARWPDGMSTLKKSDRLRKRSKGGLAYVRYLDDFPARPLSNTWTGTSSSFSERVYVVQTTPTVVERCVLMATDPGDLVLDPTCGSGTTATVAEQWGRRWITIDTSRVAMALARARIMGARYPYFLLADSREGQLKESEVTRTAPSSQPVQGDIRHGFVYERVPHITLKSIANNAEIDVIWERFEQKLETVRRQLSVAIGQDKTLEEWEVPRTRPDNWPPSASQLLDEFWTLRIGRQKEIDASIAAKAEFEFLYDKPYEDKKKVRVAGPFTVESLSPHRVLGMDENDELIDPLEDRGRDDEKDFVTMVLDNLKTAGVQQSEKKDKINFSSITTWPGEYVCAEGRYDESGTERRAGIFVGPEFGTVQRVDLVAAAREAGDAGFDVLIACAFAYEAHSTEFSKLGRLPVLKARMNADLHMAEDLKNTGKGNLFVIFGEPDIELIHNDDGRIQVKVRGVDVFHPSTGEVRSDGVEGIACWFVDTDYNEESFFVRQAYFLGANDPYKSLKTTLKAEINEEAWSTLHSDTSRPFEKPSTGRIAVKVINHLGDEVMKVFRA